MFTQHLTRSTARIATAAVGCALAVTTVVGTVPAGATEATDASARAGARLDRTLQDTRIKESSGLAASSRFDGVVLTHNDSGDESRIYAVDHAGRTQAIWTLDGARSWDWEDISSGPGHTFWVGDIGDNDLEKPNLMVYKFTEPTRLRNRTLSPSQYTGYSFVYPGGVSRNAEALLVRDNGQLTIVTKDKNGGAVFQAPKTLSSTKDNVLRRVASAPAIITGGAVSPDGSRIVLRSYRKVYFYTSLVKAPYRVVGVSDPGESITYAASGGSLLTGAEGVRSPVWRTGLG